MPSILQAGDIAFARFAADAPDSFSFVPLVPIDAGTVILFTDNAWNGDGTLRAGEGTVSWTAGAAVAAGTTLVLTAVDGASPASSTGTAAGSGAFNLSTAGDAVIAYQGAVGAPERVLAAVSTTTFLTGGAATPNTSYLPGTGTATAADDLAEGRSAVVLSPEAVDNGAYAGGTVGTAAGLRAALNTAANWTTGEDAVPDAPAAFAVADAGAPVADVAVSPVLVSVAEGGAGARFTVVLSAQPASEVVIPLDGGP